MNDNELIKIIAGMWVENGGDAEGLDWCYRRIKEEIEKLSKLKRGK